MSSHGSKADAQMSRDGSKEDAHYMIGGRDKKDVVVPGDQVTQFMNNLRNFSDYCAHYRKVVETARLDGADEMNRMKVEMGKAMKETDENRKRRAVILSELLLVEKNCKETNVTLQKEQAEVTEERENLSEQVKEAKKMCEQTTRMYSTVVMKVNFV